MDCYDCRQVQVYDLLCQRMPYAWLDMKRRTEILKEAGISNCDFAIYVDEFLSDIGWDYKETPDICCIAYDYILQKVRTEIEEKTGIDILNNLELGNFGTWELYVQ